MKPIVYAIMLVLLLPAIAWCENEKERPVLHLNGALRFNYNYSDWNPGHRNRGGDFGYDVFLLHPTASYKGFLLDADFRFYNTAFGGFMLKHGWIGYRLNPSTHVEMGLTKVPFGLQPRSSFTYFYQISYYVGLEEDADMGLKWVYQTDQWEYTLAFFKNADELLFGAHTETSDDRHGYDVAGRNKEINQFNLQLIYKSEGEGDQQFGISAEFGRLYNLDTRKKGNHFAFAGHYELKWKGINVKAQITTYAMYPRNAPGETRELVVMTAYGAPYVIAAKANIYTLSIAHTFRLRSRWMQSIQFYHDTGWLQKWNKHFKNSVENVTGLLMKMGPVRTYIDYAMGKHHTWLGPDWAAFGPGAGSNSWHARFNINIGYYF